MIEVSWRGIDSGSRETAVLTEEGDTIRVVSRVRGPHGTCAYTLIADDGWRFRSLMVEVGDRSLRVVYDEEDQLWTVDGRSRPDLRDAREVDLAMSPLSNTLPIRRLRLPIGASSDITTAYITVPNLQVVADPQRYTRISEHEYRYESRDSDFRRTISVDGHGLVLAYPGLFERIEC